MVLVGGGAGVVRCVVLTPGGSGNKAGRVKTAFVWSAVRVGFGPTIRRPDS